MWEDAAARKNETPKGKNKSGIRTGSGSRNSLISLNAINLVLKYEERSVFPKFQSQKSHTGKSISH